MLSSRQRVCNKERILQLIALQRPHLQALGVQRLGLFGSFARGEQHDDSDIDLLVEFVPGHKNFDNFMQLAFLLEDMFGRRVELVTPESLSPYIRPYVLDEVEYASITS
jgi:predicted nucleotidyltransferase